ncbi:MAG: M20 family metallo-hydrolase [Chloroflexi bacterium]|nr:M20 family metallo-hydrolase [Chloroflexota bacterium]
MSELQAWIEALAQVGATGDGGVFRGALSREEQAAHELVAGWMRRAGLSTRRDAAGNLWGRVDGTRPGAPAVVTGSHLDSVRNGGSYDGPYGVLGGLIAVREVVHRHGPPTRPLEVVAFTGEEGSRFPIGVIGSRAVAGRLGRQHVDTMADDAGVTIGGALRRAGLDPDRVGEARRSDIAAYIEMHIEQGPMLEAQGVPIAVVQGIVGTQRVSVTVHGRADHAGTTPMSMRRDALVGAARMITHLPDLATRFGRGVLTSGRIAAFPGSTNVVPERVEFTIDCRHPEEERKQEMLAAAKAICEREGAALGLGVTWRLPAPGHPPVAMSEQIQALLRASCRELGMRYMDMFSGAGHDAQMMASICLAGMLFIPCRDGRSHTPEEHATAADMEAGIAGLARCLYKLAYEDALGRGQ